jgi:CheY-like chemotaxis protein
MEISCSNCKGKFKIPDERIPKGQTFSIPCPKCKEKITVSRKGASTPPAAAKKAAPPAQKVAGSKAEAVKAKTAAAKPEAGSGKSKTLIEKATSEYDSADKPFDFIEEGVETALVCEPDPKTNGVLQKMLEKMGYVITSPKNPMDALKQMRFHNFNLVLLNERFGTSNPDENHVRKYLDRLSMEFRREIFVILLTDRFRTNDNMAAFNKSVNLILNNKDIEQLRKVLATAISEHRTFYRIYKESMKAVGIV